MAKAPPVRISGDDLAGLIRSIFVAAGMSGEHAQTMADVFSWANLRGVDSHGISRVPRYIELFDKGMSKAQPDIRVERPRAAAIIVDADAAPGPVACARAMQEAIATARETGVAWASVRGTALAGAVGYYTEMAAKENMAGLAIVAGVPNMAYVDGAGKALATSPLAISVPSAGDVIPTLDMATATIALGRIAQYRNKGQSLPEGAALSDEGEPTTDPNVATIPTPMAGAKGAGMSLMFEFLSSVLVGNGIFADFHNRPETRRHRQNASLIAVDIEAFTPLDKFKSDIQEALQTVNALPAASGSGPLRFPGERGAASYAERMASGVPVPAGVWDKVAALAGKLNVALPDVTA